MLAYAAFRGSSSPWCRFCDRAIFAVAQIKFTLGSFNFLSAQRADARPRRHLGSVSCSLKSDPGFMLQVCDFSPFP